MADGIDNDTMNWISKRSINGWIHSIFVELKADSRFFEKDQSINSEELESTGIRNILTRKLREFIQIPSHFIDATTVIETILELGISQWLLGTLVASKY